MLATPAAAQTTLTGDYKITGKLETGTNLQSGSDLIVNGWSILNQRTVYQNGGNPNWTVENVGGTLTYYPNQQWQGPAIHFYPSSNVALPGKVSIGVCQSAAGCPGEPGIGGAMLAVGGPVAVWGKVTVLNYGAPWPDYVFRRGYRLRPLAEVGRYVQANHHLPDVPSVAQVQSQGVELAEMNATLLRKVEELTLYLLQQQAANAALAERVAKLERTK